MKTQRIIFNLSILFSVGSLFGQTNVDMERVLPAMFLGAGSFSDFERTNVLRFSSTLSSSFNASRTNINCIVDTPKPCPPEYTNIISNTNLFSLEEQKSIKELPLQYKNVTTNSPPADSNFIGMESGSFWLEGFTIGRFRQNNSEAQIKVFFDKDSSGKASGASFRTKSGDGYDISFNDNGSVESFRQFKNGKLDGLWADFKGDHCAAWMRFVDGKAVGKWLVWNRTGSLYMEAEFKEPYDFLRNINLSF